MPPFHDNPKKSVNYYGVFTLWASILIFASFFVLYTSGCGKFDSLDIRCILATTFVIGILMFLFSFCNIAVRLFHKKCCFYFKDM
ncbi:hypothetical protein RDWZM_004258 [Blomia tropicalis]|uniref:Uncharacterized protein n=1 Tax=Blomia tropicalis TaxID=40697 RepID=A0A9Q0RRM4_BLOTA|nr:hypothetical protein RDWZM_004258 [Blomia tropicalis]